MVVACCVFQLVKRLEQLFQVCVLYNNGQHLCQLTWINNRMHNEVWYEITTTHEVWELISNFIFIMDVNSYP